MSFSAGAFMGAPGAAPGQMLIVGRFAGGGHPDWADNKAVDAATAATRIANLQALMSDSLPSTKTPHR
jgi:hypothetical protein